ncbi:MAG TPA: DUF421 domain-containing protein [Candidatus Pullichristensenella excrementigallinarum]|uniref:DUF421 domain-containing protein n=1 Tax=Candidatus Pullichristensenella excrementigallinarum TaxID=2840907 RepID=A0A9D1IDP2_9FIRM|nr:DUF421 domain-containing protein [Candidatus Pullichristensenella excrementigallinarum]
MFTLFFRALILYVVMIVTMRGLGKRQMGQYQPYEFAMAILLADLISTPMESISTPLLYGILPVAALFLMHSLITLLSIRFDKFRAIVSGKPSVVVSKGVINEKELRRLCLNLSDLLEGLRNVGILDPSEVGTAVVEANGKLTAFPPSTQRPPTSAELGVDPGYEGLPLILIMDGRVQNNNLRQSGKDLSWLNGVLQEQNLRTEQIYLASLDTHGTLTLQRKQGGIHKIQALDPEEVGW